MDDLALSSVGEGRSFSLLTDFLVSTVLEKIIDGLFSKFHLYTSRSLVIALLYAIALPIQVRNEQVYRGNVKISYKKREFEKRNAFPPKKHFSSL